MIAILAAGRSSRFNGRKLSAPCAGKMLGEWALDAALGTGARVVWVGAPETDAIVAGRCEHVVNKERATGMASSVHLAARVASCSSADRLLIMLADMPLIDGNILRELLACPAPAACPYDEGRFGAPSLFAPAHYPALASLRGDAGASRILRDLPHLTSITVDPICLLDVDTPEDLARAEQALLRRA